tara:strand:- start:27 stop:569 length:543 start_codon:yes stop_codon:yes gene_type:complete
MKRRCLEPRHNFYHRYGGRGITVCERWLASFLDFYEDMGKKPPGTSLDRRDNDGNYDPDNCRWATPLQQSQNTANVVLLTYNGETLCLKEWARKLFIDASSLKWRIDNWGLDRALSTPRRKEGLFAKAMFTHNGETLSIADWSARTGIPRRTLHGRIRRWGIERALTKPPMKTRQHPKHS